MRKVLLLSGGVVAAFAAAVFVGAAAATTGAPVFYDARYPAPATTEPSEYDVEQGVTGPGDPALEEGAEAIESPTPDGATESPTPPGAPTPTPTPEPTPTPAPTPGATPTPAPDEPGDDDPSVDDPPIDGPEASFDRPDRGTPTPEEQQAWLAFQQIVRECMAESGYEYLYWEWWNPSSHPTNRFAPMPADLPPDEVAAWELALHGDAGVGDDYRWQQAGCWGYAVHVTGGTN
ncbi:hypothetical protein [Agromyces sp. Marseille-P2726]|uniref:hypothetical protein n=1 Tax=Agromyces sp. Marseille-P2726 TaxID=2709132 RepID=UPI00156DD354|nr:hypothetical protein [Agromyces sp. Marseille-P2726]